MLAVKDYHAPTDRIIASELHRRIRAHGEKTKDIAGLLPAEEELAALYDNTRLGDPEFIQGCLEKTPEQLAALQRSGTCSDH